MPDMQRLAEAHRLRDSGLTLKAAGDVLGVSAERVRQMLHQHDRIRARQEAERDNPSLIPWWRDLPHRTAETLQRAGFTSREDCVRLCELPIISIGRHKEVNFFPRSGDGRDEWATARRLEWFPLATLNDVRQWLGLDPITKPKRPQKPRLDAAVSLLSKHGYTVTAPKPHKAP